MSRRTHSELYYHYAWATKYREKLISPQWGPRLHGYIAAKCEHYGHHLLAVGGIEDHVHCLIRAEPEINPSDIAGKIKGSSSHFVNGLRLCSRYFSWQEGFGVTSVSPRGVRDVTDYINNQRARHAQGRTDKLLETMEEEGDVEEWPRPSAMRFNDALPGR